MPPQYFVDFQGFTRHEQQQWNTDSTDETDFH